MLSVVPRMLLQKTFTSRYYFLFGLSNVDIPINIKLYPFQIKTNRPPSTTVSI